MTYLQLCQRVIQEAGISSSLSTVTSQSGMKQKVVDWVALAWIEIQNKRDWDFLWESTVFSATIGQRDYSPVNNLQLDPSLSTYVTDSFRIYETDIGLGDQSMLSYVPWATWRTGSLSTGAVSSGRPSQFTILPNNNIRFDVTPEAGYTIYFDYYRTPVSLVNNTDVPALPEQFHSIILYQALIHYAAEEDASEIYQDAQIQYQSIMNDLLNSSLPIVTLPISPLA